MLRIKELRNDKNMTLDELSLKSGVSKRMISAYESNENDITLKKLQNIATALGVSVSVLIGEEKKGDNDLQINPININRKTIDVIKDIQEVPLYNIEATAGLVELFKGTSNDAILNSIKIPGIASCDGAIYVTGDSMYPLLKSGDIILFKEVDINRIFWGEMYLLSAKVTDWEEYITVKFIQKSELGNEYVKLVSQNQHHQPKDILLSDISAIALIRASIRLHSS